MRCFFIRDTQSVILDDSATITFLSLGKSPLLLFGSCVRCGSVTKPIFALVYLGIYINRALIPSAAPASFVSTLTIMPAISPY